METEDQQIKTSLESEDVEIEDIGVESHNNSNSSISNDEIEKLEQGDEQSVLEDDDEDGDVTILSFWFGDQVSILSMFYERLLHQYIYPDLSPFLVELTGKVIIVLLVK